MESWCAWFAPGCGTSVVLRVAVLLSFLLLAMVVVVAAVVDSCCVCCRGGYGDSRHAKLWNVAVSSARFLYFIFLKVFRVGIDHAHCSSELASVSISSLDHLCKARLTPWQTALIVLYYCIRWLVYYILHIIYLYYILYCIFYITCFMSYVRKASLVFQFSASFLGPPGSPCRGPRSRAVARH